MRGWGAEDTERGATRTGENRNMGHRQSPDPHHPPPPHAHARSCADDTPGAPPPEPRTHTKLHEPVRFNAHDQAHAHRQGMENTAASGVVGAPAAKPPAPAPSTARAEVPGQGTATPMPPTCRELSALCDDSTWQRDWLNPPTTCFHDVAKGESKKTIFTGQLGLN